MTEPAIVPVPARSEPAEELRTLPVPDGLHGLRADSAIARLFGFSRARAAELCAGGRIEQDGRPLAKSDPVYAAALLEVRLPPTVPPDTLLETPVAGLRIVADDPDFVVVDKPVGVAAHPSPGWSGPTVVGGLRAMGVDVATAGAAERQGVVQRLDAGTTGLMVVAKTELAYRSLKDAFRARAVDKRYRALVQGHPDPTSGTIDAPIDRHPERDWKFAVVAGGRPSVTHYETIEAFRAASLLTVVLETGRTHQIRVHMAAIRHPCVGDSTYGADPTLAARLQLSRQWLHAARLGFRHPRSGRPVEFCSADPPDLAAAVQLLRDGS